MRLWGRAGLARSVGGLGVVLALLSGAPAAAQPQPSPSSSSSPGSGSGQESPEARLADRYAPVVFVRVQEENCDSSGEAFEPADVGIVLDNPEVFLRQVGNDDPVAVRGPSAGDLFDLREGWYLDFPGDALQPGCIFEEDHRRFARGRPSVVYAHVATEDRHPGLIALQYWFFWYHNLAKNNHEGDWEFIQLLFEADTAEEALGREPIEVGYAQHEGGERSSWGDDKLELINGRPVVYPAVGSHATYYGQALHLGRSGNEGFGCDNTEGPSRRIDPDVVLLPDEVTDPDDPFAWLTFRGRWGQREAGFFNGPTGPATKSRWTEPVTWHEGLRDSSVVIPGGDAAGSRVLIAFCDAVEVGSTVLTRVVRSPFTAVATIGALIWLGTLLARRTRWAPIGSRQVREPRAMGQILRTAVRSVADQPVTMVVVGLVYIPMAMATAVLQALVQQLGFVDSLLSLVGDRSGPGLLLSLVLGGIGNLLAFVIVSLAMSIVLDQPGADPRPRIFAGLRPLLGALVRAVSIVGALFVSIVGIPWGIRQLVRYQFAPQVVALEGSAGRAALDRSIELVRGRWWWTASMVALVQIVVGVVGLIFALLVLVAVTSIPLWAFNVLTSLVSVLLVPIAASAMTYAYGSIVASEDAVPETIPEEAVSSARRGDG